MQPRELNLPHFQAVQEEVKKLHENGYDRAGNWDLAQNLQHLSYFMKGALEGYSFRVPWFVKKLFGNYFKNKILKSRRMKRGVYTPQNPLPASNLDEAEVVTDFLHLLDRFDKHPGEYQESPFFGKMSRDECRALNLIHCNHHLAFLLPRG